ncbi:hypothetical protein [Brachyspira sp.]|uniref:hypothetical protein n=1 Tax=Brachyspira sp. TaxID=1977261 RepID=UPI003D7C893A
MDKKTTPFRIRNSLVKTLSLRGDSRSNPIYVDCFTPFAMTIKNNFAILNNNVASAPCINNSEKSIAM